MNVPAWDCEAYGEGAADLGALCFFSQTGRLCTFPADCSAAMAAERLRVFGRIGELAAAGDPDGLYLASVFTDPEQLLGGGAAAPPVAD